MGLVYPFKSWYEPRTFDFASYLKPRLTKAFKNIKPMLIEPALS